MISNDPFMSVFGASKPDASALDFTPQIAAFAVKQGFAVVVIEPGGKKPLCTLTARQVNQADAEARELAAESGDRHAERRRHKCGIYHALDDPAKAMAVVRRMIKMHGPVNLGVELGRSRMVVVDVDTEEEKAAFVHDLKRLGTGESSTLEPTVLSPGKQNADGDWTHRGGGHYWFRPPAEWEGGGQGVHKVTNDVGSYTILWADRQVLVPPSIRAEGPYRMTAPPLPLPAWLLGKIGGAILAHDERQERTFQRLTGGDASSIDVWSAGRPWEEMLLPDGWTPTGLLDHCSCPTWTRPGDWSNPKSATAHEPGCTRYDTEMGSGPLHVWTDSPPGFLSTAPRTLTKVQYLAWRYHGGGVGATLAELGISQDGGPAMDLTFTGSGAPLENDASPAVERMPVAQIAVVEEEECPFLAASAPVLEPVADEFTPPGDPASDEEIEEEAARIEEEEAAGADDPLDQPAPGDIDWEAARIAGREKKIREAAEHIRIQREAKALVEAELGETSDDDALLSRIKSGGAFILDIPEGIPAMWGTDQRVAWAVGEALIIVGPPGVGKTTIAHQVLSAMLTGGGEALGLNVPALPDGGKILYLGCDRPAQIARAMRRLLGTVDRTVLDEKLIVWQGPPLADFAKDQGMLTRMCQLVSATVVIVDSLKDVAIGLSEDAVGAGLNNSRQNALTAGIQVMELHHLTKHGPNGTAPTTLADVYGSAWITAGAGSVLLIWGQAGDVTVSVRHLKQPGEPVGPLTAHHDHDAGTTSTDPFDAAGDHDGTPKKGRPSAQRDKLWAALVAYGDGGCTRGMLQADTDIARKTVDDAWKLWIDTGKTVEVFDKETASVRSGWRRSL